MSSRGLRSEVDEMERTETRTYIICVYIRKVCFQLSETDAKYDYETGKMARSSLQTLKTLRIVSPAKGFAVHRKARNGSPSRNLIHCPGKRRSGRKRRGDYSVHDTWYSNIVRHIHPRAFDFPESYISNKAHSATSSHTFISIDNARLPMYARFKYTFGKTGKA